MHCSVLVLIFIGLFLRGISGESPATHPCSTERHSPSRCEFRQHIEHGLKAYCSGALHDNVLSAEPFPRSLVLCFWPAPHGHLDPAEVLPPQLPLSKSLRRLVIVYSNISALSDDFCPGESLEELILSGLGLTWLSETAFASLPRLRHLDLSHNQLTFLQQLSSQCPRPTCACHMVHAVWGSPVASSAVGSPMLIPVITVNCSGQSLKELPEVLPELPGSNMTLDVSNNQITNIQPLAMSSQYARVQDLLLDGNFVDNIDALEGAAWLMSFRVLSLRRNLLQQLPTYAFDNALEINRHAIRIYLGENPWRCDCSFTPTFQDFLIKYATLMADLNDIKCAKDDSENSLQKIRSITRRAVCQDSLTSTLSGYAALDVINGLLGTLVLLVFVRLGYDYYHYKRSGKLPWIASKLL